MKSSQKKAKQPLPSLKRYLTPSTIKKKPLISSTKLAKSKKVNTEPLPSPNNSFTEESKKPSLKSTSRTSSPSITVKLALYLKIEKKLWEMVQSVSEQAAFTKLRDEFWELIKKNRVWDIEDYFKDPKIKKSIKRAFITQLCGVMVAPDLYRANDSINNLKNLSLFIHQNFIEVLFTINSNLKLAVNASTKQLRSLIEIKRMTTVADKHMTLSKNTEILSGLLKEICKHFRQYSKQSALSSSIFSILKSINRLNYVTVREVLQQALTLSEPILIPPEEPFLPSVPTGTYTLVLDLDETLVHFVQSKDEGAVYIRPGCDEFLKTVSEWYEVVVFTAGLQDVIHK